MITSDAPHQAKQHVRHKSRCKKGPNTDEKKKDKGGLGPTVVRSYDRQSSSTQPTCSWYHLIPYLTGKRVKVILKGGTFWEGIFYTANDHKDVILKDIQEIVDKTYCSTLKDTLVIPAHDVVSITDELSPRSEKKTKHQVFKTDQEISSFTETQQERELQRWQPQDSASTSAMHSLEDTKYEPWDQFSTSEELFGLTTNFDEEDYTTKLDRSVPDYQEKEKRATKLATEIQTSSHNNPHVLEERGYSLQTWDEENKYGAVYRPRQENNRYYNKHHKPARNLTLNNNTSSNKSYHHNRQRTDTHMTAANEKQSKGERVNHDRHTSVLGPGHSGREEGPSNNQASTSKKSKQNWNDSKIPIDPAPLSYQRSRQHINKGVLATHPGKSDTVETAKLANCSLPHHHTKPQQQLRQQRYPQPRFKNKIAIYNHNDQRSQRTDGSKKTNEWTMEEKKQVKKTTQAFKFNVMASEFKPSGFLSPSPSMTNTTTSELCSTTSSSSTCTSIPETPQWETDQDVMSIDHVIAPPFGKNDRSALNSVSPFWPYGDKPYRQHFRVVPVYDYSYSSQYQYPPYFAFGFHQHMPNAFDHTMPFMQYYHYSHPYPSRYSQPYMTTQNGTLLVHVPQDMNHYQLDSDDTPYSSSIRDSQ